MAPSRTSDDIDMKLGPVANLDKRNKTTSKIFEDNVILENCEVIVIFLIYGQFGAICKPDYGYIACKTCIFIKNNLLSYKNWNSNWKTSSNTALTLLHSVKVLFLPENPNVFAKK